MSVSMHMWLGFFWQQYLPMFFFVSINTSKNIWKVSIDTIQFFFSFPYIHSGNYILVWIGYILHIFYMDCTSYKVISLHALTSPAVIISIRLSGFKCNHSEPCKNLVLILYLAEKNGCYFQALSVNPVCWGFSLNFSKIIAFIPPNMNFVIHIVVICWWLE